MWIALWTGAATAQVPVPDLNAQLFRPSLDSRYTLWTNDSTRHDPHTMLGRVTFHYTKDPLTFLATDGTRTRVISDIVQADVAGGYQLGPVRLGLGLPVFFYADGAGSPTRSGFGDLALDVKGTVLQRSESALGLAFLGRLSFPTADLVGLGSGSPTAEIEAILDRDLGERVFVGTNIGFRALPDAGLDYFTDNFYVRLAAGLKTSEMSGLSAELISHGVTSEGVPSEALVGGWGRAAKGLHMRGGVGTALGHGLGTPQLRAMFALAFEPTFEPDRDRDGITDFDDKCRDEPEDLDSVEDLDGCPEPTKVTVRITDEAGEDLPGATFLFDPSGLKGKSGETAGLFGGSYALSVDAEGYDATTPTIEIRDAEAQEVAVTLKKTIVYGRLSVKIVDPDGKPIEGATWNARGTDHKGIAANADEAFQILPGTYDLKAMAPGYRFQRADVTVEAGADATVEVQLLPAKVELKAERIEIKESVFFEVKKATIKPESFALLDEVSATIVDHPELTKIRIEGHTDSRGSATSNKKLSQDRAEAVRVYMIGKGVAEERLEAVGFGEEKPLDPRNVEEAWAKNRRVDFFVAERKE